MLLSLALFENSYYNIVTITFTSLILSEMLNITTTVINFNYNFNNLCYSSPGYIP